MLNKNINLNLYKTFYDAARYDNFSTAANFTYSTQSAISKSIKKLESELGYKLFYRKANGVELTEKGRELLYYVEKAYGNLLIAERMLLENKELTYGKLSIGLPSNLYYLIIDSLIKFHKNYPNIDITVVTGTTTFLLDKLNSHQIDFFIDTLPINNYSNNLTIERIKELEYCFISNNKEKIKDIKDLENKDVILPIENTANRIKLDEYLFKHNITLNKAVNIHTSEIILTSVKKGLGIGYILHDFVKDDKDINILKITDLPKAELALVYNKRFLTNAPNEFIKHYLKDMK